MGTDEVGLRVQRHYFESDAKAQIELRLVVDDDLVCTRIQLKYEPKIRVINIAFSPRTKSR